MQGTHQSGVDFLQAQLVRHERVFDPGLQSTRHKVANRKAVADVPGMAAFNERMYARSAPACCRWSRALHARHF